ncbi:TPA: recombinase family protein [Bacillus cereus]|uniref:recombinase family protein n=1 Tax=Bacillus cereus group TaxID=86661 RepID=UPI000A301B7F|nr:recombinase family protein [Bacillus cereus]HDX9574505.1 recombinase family protein [Bacillus mobilis]MBL3739064.1 recombinase family protein [Bacillus cereus]MBL3861866.1 recombinase family protein [Bacillus cereus]MDG1600480.1 recombinase family protein [Bacillus cereus]SMD84885.1 Putative transposon Tn552 DNA-invertase bin3 [Bacillus cereus]
MNKKTFAYIRVSSKEQNEARQLKEMQELSINERDVFIDKESGKDFNRSQYQALKQCLRKGDLLYIKSIDRFGRNSKEIKREWEDITQNIKADIKVIDMPLLDTTQYKDQLGNFVSELILQVLAFVSERERDNILQRQSEGIAFAKAKGKHLGRPQLNLSTISKQQRQILEKNYLKWKNKEITGVGFMEMLGLKKNSFYKIIKEYEDVI